MKSPPWIYPQFMSPMSGRINTAGVQSLTPNYTFVGDNNGFVLESPILIDIRLELARLRDLLGTTPFLLQEAIAGFDNSQPLNEVSNGLIMNAGGFIVPASLTENNFWVGSPENLPIETSTIPGGAISLLYNNVFVGNISNLATAQPTIQLGNAPNLTYQNIWRGDITNRPIESDSLTTTESSLSDTITTLSNLANIVNAISSTVDALSSSVNALETGLAGIGGFAAIILLQAQVLGLIGAVTALSSRLDNDENNITTLQNQVSIINGQLSSINTQLSTINGQINTINSDISTINFQIAAINSQISTIITDINNLVNATYIIQTSNTALPNAQVLASLSTGIVKNTTTTGVLSIATPGVDYYSPGHPTTLIDDYTFNADPTLAYGNVGVGTGVFNSLTLHSSSNTGNVALGTESLYYFTTGAGNTATGYFSLFNLISASANSAYGFGAGYVLTSGDNNSFFGGGAGFTLVTGSGNSFFGFEAGQAHNNLTDCCFIGRNSDCGFNGLTNANAIGTNARVNVSNALVLGNNVSVGIGTNSPAYPLDIMGVAGISINANSNRIINVTDPVNPLDVVNLETLQSSIASLNVTLAGFVLGGPAVAGVLTTSRGPTCLLTNIPAGGNVDMGGYSLQNLAQSPIATLDAISAQFLWDLIHDNVNVTWVTNTSTNIFTAGHINPALSIEAQTQRFIFGDPILPEPTASFKLDNIYVPVVGSSSFTNSEIRNNVLSGYRWIHKTQSTETYGSLSLQKFLYANPTGIDLMIFNNDGTFSFPGIFGSLSTGILKNTTVTGTIAIATPGVDYYSPGHPTTLIDDYNAGGGTPYGNLGIGTNALQSLVLNSSSNTTNTAIGPLSLNAFTTGSANTSVGKSCLPKLISGSSTTAVGVGAGLNVTSSVNDCFFGVTAGQSFITSSGNCLFGFQAGAGGQDNLQSCSFFGNGAGASASNLIDSMALGAGATVGASATIVMGNSSITNFNIPGLNFGLTANTITSTNTNGNITVTPNGSGIISLSSNVGIGTTTPNSQLHITGSGGYRTLTLFEVANNGFQFHGFGVSGGLVYNVGSTGSSHKFYAATSSSASIELMRITATGTTSNSGCVGINVGTTPSAGCHVIGGVQNVTNEDSVIRAEGSSNATKIEINNTSASGRLYELRSDNVGTFAIADRTGGVTNRLTINSSGFIGIGSGANAPLQFAAVNANRKIVFVEVGNNDHQVTALGAPSTGIRFQVSDTAKAFIFFAGTSSSASNELARITGGGALLISRIANDVNSPSVTPTVSLGAVGVVGTGATSSFVGGEVGGRFTLNTGTGVLTTGTIATFTLASAMPSSTFSVIFYPASGAIALNANSISSTQFTINNTGLLGLTASTTYVWNYQIVGY